ncbi:MAG TPA: hypothetical protein VNB06_18195 [Thermoanaerobaculia bacterium]|nr:hypothetical protein [Thermoanaerobaculia bacterium]
MFFARMADLFREHPEALPSELVAEDPAKEMAQMVVEILREKGVSGFGVRVHRAGGYPEGILGIDGAASEGGAARGPGRDQEGRE